MLWYLLSVGALLATPREIESLSGVAPREQWPVWFAVAPFALDNLHLGQSGPVLLWASLYAVNRARAGAGWLSGGVMGFAAAFKVPTLALLAPAALLGRPLRVLVGVVCALALISGMLVAWVGPEEAWSSTARWFHTVTTKQSPAGMVQFDQSLRYNNQSLPITLARTFGDLGGLMPKRAIRLASLPLGVIWATATGIVAALGLLGLACVVRARRRGCDREAWLVVTSLAALGMLFTSPIVWTHYFLWVLPALVALRASPRKLVIGGCVSALALAAPPLRSLGFHLVAALILYVIVATRFLRTAHVEVAVNESTTPGPPHRG